MVGLTPLVSVTWLAAHLTLPGLVILDASLRRDSQGTVQIPGAQAFDIDDKLSDRNNPLPHTLPSAETFTQEVRALGVSRESVIVVYDSTGIYSSPRARWMFQAMGHSQVAVLDGGLPAWVAAGHTVEPKSPRPVAPGDFQARLCAALVSEAGQVQAALADVETAVLDARPEGRFQGADPEPRLGLRSGHMPGAMNLPYNAVLVNGHLRPVHELSALFASRANYRRKLIFSCGSGVTACIVALAAEVAGYTDLSVYDGSWSEWGQPSKLPVVTGRE